MNIDYQLTIYEKYLRPIVLTLILGVIYSWINLADQYFALTFELIIPFIILIGVFVSPITALIVALLLGQTFDSTATMLYFYCTGYYLFTAAICFKLQQVKLMYNPIFAGIIVMLLILGKLLLLELLYIPIIVQYPKFKHIWQIFNWPGFVLIIIITMLLWLPTARMLNKYEVNNLA